MPTRIRRIASATALALFFAFAAWCRVTSLGTAPEPSADEAFFGARAEHLLRGRAADSRTPTGKLVDPVYTLATMIFTKAIGPSYIAERIPAVAFGLLAPALLLWIGPRFLGWIAALIASGTLAAMPIAIIYSRIGWEYSEVPLHGLFIAAGAWRAGESRAARLGLIAAYLACLQIAPTTVFLAPVPLAILAGRWLVDRERSAKPPMVMGLAIAGLTVGFGLYHRAGSTVRDTFQAWHFGSVDWPRFLSLYLRHHLGYCQGVPSLTGAGLFWSCWALAGTITLAGSWRLAKRRDWDRLALVVGAAASAIGYHLAVGPDGFHELMPRYGLFLLVPNGLAFGCLLESLLVEPTCRLRSVARAGQGAAILAMGFALLFTFRGQFFAEFERREAASNESFWTLRTEGKEPMKRFATILARDLNGRPAGSPRVVAAESWWLDKPLDYFLAARDDIKVASLHRLGPRRKQKAAVKTVSEGGYAIGAVGADLDWAVQATFDRDRLRRWIIAAPGFPPFVLYRLRDEAEVLATGEPATRR